MTETTVTLRIGSTLVAEVSHYAKHELQLQDNNQNTITLATSSHQQLDEVPDFESETVKKVILEGNATQNNVLVGFVLPSVLRCSHLVELQIFQCKVFQSPGILQFSDLGQLKRLSITHCGLLFLHPSIGALAQLEELELAHNLLSSLPNALQYCTNLTVLDLCNNSFTALPGVILKLPKLQTLKRSENGLMSGINEYQCGKKFQPLSTEDKVVQGSYNPDSLQFICTKQLLSIGLYPWRYAGIAYSLRAVMADKQTHLYICNHCGTARKNTDAGVWVTNIMHQFVGNTYIPFRHIACSQQCAHKIHDKVYKLSKESEREMDEQYKLECAAAASQLSSKEDCVYKDPRSRKSKMKRKWCGRRSNICAIM